MTALLQCSVGLVLSSAGKQVQSLEAVLETPESCAVEDSLTMQA